MKDELGLTVSIGLSWNKIFAKFGSDYKKPDAITVINQDNYKQIVWPLPVTELLYVGKRTGIKLNNCAVFTIKDLALRDPKLLQLQLGKWGLILSDFARGLDSSPVRRIDERSVIKSIGNSTTTPRDIISAEEAKLVFICLAESVAARLRDNGLKCRSVEIHLRDSSLYSYTRQRKLPSPTELMEDILAAAMQLLNEHYCFRSQHYLRSIGVRAIDLIAADSGMQLDLFAKSPERQENLARTIDSLRYRFGYNSILRASCLLDKELTNLNAKDDHVIHPVSFFR